MSPQPLEVFVDVTGDRPPPVPSSPRPDRITAVMAVVAAVIVFAAVAVFVRESDSPPVDDDPPDADVPDGPDGQGGPDGLDGLDGLGDLTISVSAVDDDIVVRATSSTATAPWVAFELCATDPAGCAPLWTSDLDQDGSSYEARLRVPNTFVSPGGHEHDCRTGEGCVFWVTTGDRSASFELPVSEDTAPVDLVSDGPVPSIMVEPGVADDGAVRRVEVSNLEPGDDYTAAVCARPTGGGCVPVHRGSADSDGRAVLELRLPRVVPIRTGGPDWELVDCATRACGLRVESSTGSLRVGLGFTTAPVTAPPAIVIEGEGTAEVGALVEISGSGFDRLEASTAEQARWMLCGERPASLTDLASTCATPRTTRAATIGADGEFSLAILAPDPSVLRVWTDREPLVCDERCWIVFLAEPFPEVVAAPLEIRPGPG